MKNKYLILILSALIYSCGNVDDSNNSENLNGEWKITQRIVNENEDTLGECEPFNVYTYYSNGTYSELFYAAVTNSDCLNNTSIEFTGTWQKGSDGIYTFTNSNTMSSDYLIEFLSDDSFKKTATSLSNPNDPILTTIIEKYTRIN